MNKNFEFFLKNFPINYNLYFDGDKVLEHPVGANNCEFDIFLRIMSDPASRIYSGKKQFELRKYIPKHSGLVFLYETEKVQAVTGCFYFKNYIAKPVEELWNIVGERATKREKFEAYFDGKQFGVALEIVDFMKFDKPISQYDLYNKFINLPKAPQPYVYLYAQANNKFSSALRQNAKEIIERNNL